MVIPTSIITIVAVVGFFTPSSTSGERREKMNLGIDTMLAMLIMMLMVTDQMPASSEFLPLIGTFYFNSVLASWLTLTDFRLVLPDDNLRHIFGNISHSYSATSTKTRRLFRTSAFYHSVSIFRKNSKRAAPQAAESIIDTMEWDWDSIPALEKSVEDQ